MNLLPEIERLQKTRINFLHPDEKCHLFFRRHGMCLLFSVGKHWISFLFIFLLILPVCIWLFAEGWTESPTSMAVFGGLSALGVILFHWLFLDIIAYFLGFMMVTDRRIIEFHKTVFLREEMKEIPFHQITNIHHEKTGFVQNMLDYGALRIHSNVHEPVRMRFVPHSEEKYAKISASYGKGNMQNIPKQESKSDRIRKRDKLIYGPLKNIARKITKKK